MSTVNGKSKQYALRLPHDLVARVEAYREDKGHALASEAVRELLEMGLNADSENSGMRIVMHDVMQDYTELAGRIAALEQAVRNLQCNCMTFRHAISE